MGQAIQRGVREQIVPEDLRPLFKGAVAGNDERAMFVPLADDVVQVLSGLGRQWLQAKVVQD